MYLIIIIFYIVIKIFIEIRDTAKLIPPPIMLCNNVIESLSKASITKTPETNPAKNIKTNNLIIIDFNIICTSLLIYEYIIS